MNTKVYNKLVRDKIPEIIEKSGSKCEAHILNSEEYLECLNKKLAEEFEEYMADGSIEELGDMFEVMLAILNTKGISFKEFEMITTKKRAERGGFEKKIFLEKTFEVDDK